MSPQTVIKAFPLAEAPRIMGTHHLTKASRVTTAQPSVRHRGRTSLAGRLSQPQRNRRPQRVRAPEVHGSPASHVARDRPAIPPPVPESDVRLTDRGVVLALGVAVALVIASLVCITTTALRVTAEPGSAAASSVMTR